MSEPWVCPRCGQVNAPWIPCCSCKVEYVGDTRAPMVIRTPFMIDPAIKPRQFYYSGENPCVGDEVCLYNECNGVHRAVMRILANGCLELDNNRKMFPSLLVLMKRPSASKHEDCEECVSLTVPQ